MKTKILFPVILSLALLAGSGCVSSSKTTGFIGDSASVVAGAALAYELSDGSIAATIAGGVGALGIKRMADAVAEKNRERELQEAYALGVSQTSKEFYWSVQNQQRLGLSLSQAPSVSEEDFNYIPVSTPQRRINGVIVNPSTEYIRVYSPTSN